MPEERAITLPIQGNAGSMNVAPSKLTLSSLQNKLDGSGGGRLTVGAVLDHGDGDVHLARVGLWG